MDFPILQNVLLVLPLILLITIIFRYLRLPVILGYLVVGAIVGPHAFNLVRNVENLQVMASFGVVFLMFTVGLEFSLPRMMALRKEVFLLGGLQVLLTIVLVFFLGEFFHLSWITSFIAGSIIAMSSTTVVAKQLAGQLETDNSAWQNALSILLFQDLAVIPILILISTISNHELALLPELTRALLKGIFIIVVILAVGRWLFRPLFHAIASTHLIEIFTMAVLLISMGAAWLTHFLGLSFILGAFLAGMMLAETRFRHQIEAEVRPFRDLLLGLFFVSIGAMLNMTTWQETWPMILTVLVIMLVGKCLLISLLCLVFGNDPATSLRTGLVLAQGGEFGFAMLTIALTNQLISSEQSQILLGALILSLGLAPMIIASSENVAAALFPKKYKKIPKNDKAAHQEPTIKNHVIICGYGTIGQNIARLLEIKKIPYYALDLEPDRVHEATLIGQPVNFGDAGRIDILRSAGIEQAKALVITFADTISAQRVLYLVQNLNPKLPTLVRCRNDLELVKLRNYGATQIIVESHEESLMLTYYLFLTLHIPRQEAQNIIQDVRQKHEDLLQEIFADSFSEDFLEEEWYMKQLHSIAVPNHSSMVGKSIKDLDLENINVKLVAIRRGKHYNPKPRDNTKIQGNDVLLLYGMWEDLDRAEEMLFKTKG